LGIAAGAADVALAYAQQRRQGRIDGQPVAIAAHADVQRMLLGMAARVEVLRGLVLSAAVAADLARLEPDPAARVDQAALLQFLLPIVKTLGGEWGFEVASEAMQVLGGAGYTRDWPVEQMLRDARILSILEGTTGIQALDLMQRRVLRDDPAGYRVFMAAARASRGGAALELCLDLLEEAVAWLTAHAADQTGGAVALLHLAGLAATGWVAARLAGLQGDDVAARRLRSAGQHWLTLLPAQAAAAAAQVRLGGAATAGFDGLITSADGPGG
jgi:hypothetical protein